MAYEPQEWADGAEGGTPITAARLNHIEQGVGQAAATADGAAAADHSHAAADTTSGTFTVARIPELSISKIANLETRLAGIEGRIEALEGEAG